MLLSLPGRTMPSSTPPPVAPLPDDRRTIDRRNLVLCGVLPLGALAIAWPFVELGVGDDCAYVHMAKTLADTGRFAYNGWAAMPLGVQVWWAAGWIRLFGFSFTVTRLSLLPLAVAVPPLVYLLARRARLSATDSLFAAALLATHAEFLDLAPTFMSDVPSLCLLLASLLAFTRAVESADDDGNLSRVLGWLLVGMLCGVVGGTIRQNVWLALLAGPAVLAVRPGVRTGPRLAALACLAAGAACLVLGIRWFNAQPYAIPSRPAPLGQAVAVVAGGLVALAPTALLGCVLPCMTAVAFCLPALGLRSRPRWAFVAAALLSTATCAWLQRRQWRRLGAAILDGSIPDGVAAACGIGTATLAYLQLLALVLLIAMASWDLLRKRSTLLDSVRRMPPAVAVSLAYAAVYCLALTQSLTTTGVAFTRYFLVTIPIATVCILSWAGSRDSSRAEPDGRRSAWGWLLLAVMAVSGIVQVHDHFASLRARGAAIAYLRERGVPRNRICGGFLLDHWEQLERAGHVNNRLVRNPPDGYRPVPPDGYPLAPSPKERDLVDTMTPEYILEFDPPGFPGDGTEFPSFPYAAWWPATRGRITIQHQTPAPRAAATQGAGGGR